MKKISVICPHPYGFAPSQRLKFEQYFSHWEDNEWKVDVEPFQTKRFWSIAPKEGYIYEKVLWTLYGYWRRIIFLKKISSYDIVYVHLWVTPFGPPFFEWLYCKLAKKVIFDIDDLVFLGHASNANSWVSRLKGKNKPIYLMKKANHIITTTPFLINYCKKYSDLVTGIPPTVDETRIYPKEKVRNKKLVIGWSGSHSTLKYLKIIEPSLQRLAQKYEFEFLVFGVDKYEIDNIFTRSVEWSEKIENNIFNEFDIAVYPLELELWSEGKYGGKMIQYFAAGLPMIVSNANDLIPSIVRNHENGILVNNSETDWYNAFECLIQDIRLRNKIAVNARKTFEFQFSIDSNKNKYLEILNSVASN
jgi:glycosyltransferase involved in cell wall biosynthesis